MIRFNPFRFFVRPAHPVQKVDPDQRWREAVARAREAHARKDTRGYHHACIEAAEAANAALGRGVRA